MNGLPARAETLCRDVAHGLADRPLYVLLRSELPADMRGDGETLGCTMKHLAAIVRPELERLGRWRGIGPAMIIDAAGVAATLARRPRESRRRCFLPAFLAIALHELAHILDVGIDDANPAADPPAGLVALGRRILAAEAAGELPPTNGDGADIPWRWHEWRFIRIAIHLAHRATCAGVDVSPLNVFDAPAHGLSDTWEYAAALGDEPQRMASLDFAAIRAAPVPPAFAAVWRRDMLRWLLPATSREQLSQTLAACARRIFIPAAAQDATAITKGRMPC
ncbi:MAG TPA: hypothetical protein PKC49_05005 [Phycisphaerae bacterium]|nr:hypothetical protein [Phycisphaerae bacterium]